MSGQRQRTGRGTQAGQTQQADQGGLRDQSEPAAKHSPRIISLPDLPAVPCPCGVARRGFADQASFPGTVHLTEISCDAATHYHRRQTEVYVILDCDSDAAIELDGTLRRVKPLDAIMIPPHVRHRAVGAMRVLIICSPAFDPADEYIDGPEANHTTKQSPG